MDVSVFTEVQLQLLPLKFTAILCFGELIFSGKFSHLTGSCRLTILISPKRNTSSAFQNTNTGCIYVSLKKRGNVSCIMNSHKITKLLIHVFYYFGAGILDYTSTGGIPQLLEQYKSSNKSSNSNVPPCSCQKQQVRILLAEREKISTGSMQAGVRKFPDKCEIASYGIFL